LILLSQPGARLARRWRALVRAGIPPLIITPALRRHHALVRTRARRASRAARAARASRAAAEV